MLWNLAAHRATPDLFILLEGRGTSLHASRANPISAFGLRWILRVAT